MSCNDKELAELIRIGRAAAKIVMDVYATPFKVEMKGPGDPVTRADREANALICKQLEVSFPGDAILAEESVPKDEAEIAARLRSERVFFVDPLDGTQDFANRTGDFAVMIGLAVRGRADVGVVVIPTTGQVLAGRVQVREAFVEAGDGSRQPLTVSQVDQPAEATAVVSRAHGPRMARRILTQLGVHHVVPCGSVGVKVARVATAAADIYLHTGPGTKRWDTCGPEAILHAAGGRFSDANGTAIDYTDSDLGIKSGLLATNGVLHEAVVAAAKVALR